MYDGIDIIEPPLPVDASLRSKIRAKIGLLNAIREAATEANCIQLASMIWERALDGDHRYVEILLDRLEGKVVQGIVVDTVINVYHNIPPRGSGAAPLTSPTERSPILISDQFEELT